MMNWKSISVLVVGVVLGAAVALVATNDSGDEPRTESADLALSPGQDGGDTPDDANAEGPSSNSQSEVRQSSPAEAPDAPPGSPVTREVAATIAADAVGGTANRVYSEDDYGAVWEVEVNAADGEYDVYVDATGEVVRTKGPFAD